MHPAHSFYILFLLRQLLKVIANSTLTFVGRPGGAAFGPVYKQKGCIDARCSQTTLLD